MDRLSGCMALAAARYPHPVYLRFGKKPMPHLHQPGTRFEIGKAIVLRAGSDVTFVATGEPLAAAVKAADLLESEGVSCGVISMHTVKPFDRAALLEAACKTRVLITVEEHSIYEGLGECCASVLMQERVSLPFKIVGLPDEYTVTGNQAEILAHYGITPDGLANTALRLLEPERSP